MYYLPEDYPTCPKCRHGNPGMKLGTGKREGAVICVCYNCQNTWTVPASEKQPPQPETGTRNIGDVSDSELLAEVSKRRLRP